MKPKPNQSMEYHHKSSYEKKKNSNPQAWAGEVMATVFWDADGVIPMNLLKPGTTI